VLFNSLVYIAFLAVTIAAFWTLRGKARLILLLFASYVFYAAWNPYYILLIIISTSIDFFVSHRLHTEQRPGVRKALLAACVSMNLGILGFFKYFGLLSVTTASLMALGHIQVTPPSWSIILPLGISFYTFEAISYVVDVYRGAAPIRSFLHYSLYIMFFPHLIAGPIVRFRDIVPQFERGPHLSPERLTRGLHLLCAGLLYKTVLADHLAEIVNTVYKTPLAASSIDVWAAVVAFSGQIYFDFLSYTVMAQGSALLLGFELCKNFDTPYLSRNIADFWNKWHISLSSWLRDYLYIPLGGNRRGLARTYCNLLITMGLGGLWHGASWQFLVWGLLHGAYLTVHRFIQSNRPAILSLPSAVATPLSIGTTFLCVSLAWVFFRAPDFDTAAVLLGTLSGHGWHPMLVSLRQVGLVAGLTALYPAAVVWGRRHPDCQFVDTTRPWRTALILSAALVAGILYAANNSQQFIYFEF
jgi:D-alanyl-lipoteichoic acid acyltransferase DltB (MBOAT superfamily)